VAGNAAYFSISGLSSLFAGATLSVMIMASSLELAKLISAGFLYNYWNKINKFLRFYLVVGTVILILITSAGIYGFLTSAYQVTADEMSIIDKKTEIIQLKKNRYIEQLANYNTEKNQLNESIGELSKGLSNNVIQYKDRETGKIITTTSSSTRNVLQSQLEESKLQRDKLTLKEDTSRDSITSLDIQILDLKSNNSVAAEIGPLRYISNITGIEMDSVVNWFALFIVFVFDPLAVTLVIAFATALKVDKGEKGEKVIMENIYQVYGDDGKNLTKDDKSDVIVENLPSFECYDMQGPVQAMHGCVEQCSECMERENNVSYQESKVETDKSTMNDTTIGRESEEKTPETEDPSDGTIPPNEKLKEAFKKYRDIPFVSNPDEMNIYNPKWIEYDQGGWNNRYKENEYFYHPWFDWKKPQRWLYNQRAVEFWLKYKGGTQSQLQKYRDMYPDKDNMKIYS